MISERKVTTARVFPGTRVVVELAVDSNRPATMVKHEAARMVDLASSAPSSSLFLLCRSVHRTIARIRAEAHDTRRAFLYQSIHGGTLELQFASVAYEIHVQRRIWGPFDVFEGNC
jgi:hypothetical protein